MRKNFERIIFAVSVCVLGVVLFIQGILYFRDLGFSNETTFETATLSSQSSAIDSSQNNPHNEISDSELETNPFFSVEQPEAIELAVSESSVEEGVLEAAAVEGPELKIAQDAAETSTPLEANKSVAPLLLSPGQKLQATPGPLMPPLNAEPLQDTEKKRDIRKDEITRAIIREHLPQASKEELEIWFEELQGVPHKAASDLLSIRKLLQPKILIKSAEKPQELQLPYQSVIATPQTDSTQQRPPSDQTGFIGFSSEADRDELLHRLKPTVDALRLSRDVIVNNIANAGTIGFKRSYVEFESLPYDYVTTPASEKAKTEPPIAVGMGSQVLQTRVSQTSGDLIKTGRALDLAIEGQGFLQVKLGEKTVLTRTGRLLIDADHRLCIRGSQKNYPLVPEIQLPPKAHSIQISDTGEVTAMVADADKEQKQSVGNIMIVCFTDPSELFPRECCLFEATPRSGMARVLTPGEKGAGLIQSGVLETSNVSISEELEELSLIKQRVDALKTVYMTEPAKPVQADLGLPAERIARPQDSRALK